MITCVWASSPVTMLPQARKAGVIIDTSLCFSSSTNLETIPVSMTYKLKLITIDLSKQQ